MITTVCMNPAFDSTIELDSLRPGGLNRALSSRVDLGGKGLNVAAAVEELGLQARCVVCCGEKSLPEMRMYQQTRQEEIIQIPVPGEMRTNVKLVTPDGLTEINEAGPMMPAEYLRSVQEAILSACEESDYAVITGSMLPGCPADFYRDLITVLEERGIRCVLDADGEALRLGLAAKPFMIKPNLAELRRLTGEELSTREEVEAAAMRLHQGGIAMVVVSLGAEGALMTAENRLFTVSAPEVQVRSTVGAGDCMVAGLLCSLLAEKPLETVLAYGVAAGSASTVTAGTQLMRKADFDALLTAMQADA